MIFVVLALLVIVTAILGITTYNGWWFIAALYLIIGTWIGLALHQDDPIFVVPALIFALAPTRVLLKLVRKETPCSS